MNKKKNAFDRGKLHHARSFSGVLIITCVTLFADEPPDGACVTRRVPPRAVLAHQCAAATAARFDRLVAPVFIGRRVSAVDPRPQAAALLTRA